MKRFARFLSIVLLVSFPLATAIPLTSPQEQEGQIVIGNPVTIIGPGVNEANPNAPQGIDGVWIELEKEATGVEPVTLAFTSTSLDADLDVVFYDASGDRFDYLGCWTPFDNPEECIAPDGATHALIQGYSGVILHFTFTYTYEA